MKRTKIVATIGPSSASKDTLKEMISSGMNVCRINFSHGAYEDHKNVVKYVRELNEELGINTWRSCLAPLSFASYTYDDFHLLMPLFVCRKWEGTPTPMEGQVLKWVDKNNLKNHSMPPADIPLISAIRDIL